MKRLSSAKRSPICALEMFWHSDPLRPWRASRVYPMLPEVGAVAKDLSVVWPPTGHEARP